MNKSENAVHIFNKYATQYQDKFMNVELYSESLDLFCANISKANAEILELACGPGNITRYLLDKRTDFQILGTDLAPNMLELAKANNPEATFQLMDCRDIAPLEKKYDAVMCGFCLPYLSKEEALQLVRDAANILHPGGLLYISTMEDEYSLSRLQKGSSGDEIFMYFHEAAYLLAAFEENKLKLLDLQRKLSPSPDGTSFTDLILLAQK